MKYSLLTILLLTGAFVLAQHQPMVNFERAGVALSIDPYTKTITGKVTYTFNAVARVDSVFLDAHNMEFHKVGLNGRKASFTNDGRHIIIRKKFKADRSYTLTLDYSSKPKQTVYFIGWEDSDPNNNQIWTQGQGKYTSHWLPSFDDMNEKIEFDVSITVDKKYTVIANGKLIATEEKEGLKKWSFDMKSPMSSYLLAFAVGNFNKKEQVSKTGVPLEMYYEIPDSLHVEPTYRHTKFIFDFLETEIGVPYPWQNYKQIPVRDFLYAGMENTGTTIFSDAYVVDSIGFLDKNYVNINAHELAHQWFGNLVTEVDGNHHWLHEGFATYYALLAEKEVFGEDYFYWKLYGTAKQLAALTEKGGGEALNNPKASSLTFYEKGAWALFALQQRIGSSAFKTGIQAYLKEHRFGNVRIDHFLEAMEQASGEDLTDFESFWIKEKDFSLERAKQLLSATSHDLAQFFDVQRELTTTATDNETIIKKYWDRDVSVYFKKQLILDYYKSFSNPFLLDIFSSNTTELRQAIAISTERVPLDLKAKFRTLLNDKSYVTIENALYRLWVYFPDDRTQYLDATKGVIGFRNKNVRLLWLTLALLTKDYDMAEKERYYEELRGYTGQEYGFEIRQGAFQWINEVFKFNDQNIKDLINASVHHTWQFKKYARNLLDKLMEDTKYRQKIEGLIGELSEKEQGYITSKLKAK
ncbi:M1 family metallopeptidase [Spongiimicrobium sp. 3-5]|uniref:M1 family metallopeptidase n=1 Tax=Spongiimicrobium sp. 3-5 TaxID=3332596 RepID=UPI003980BD05